MNALEIKPTKSSPAIWFDPDRGVLGIYGESYPENSFEFYAPLFAWLREALPSLPALRVEVSVSYMNSSSAKCMLDLLDALEAAHAEGKRVELDWFYDRENPRSLDLAEEFREDCHFPFRTAVSGG
ncbi:MAG TPA: SiaC family regulatory phosphoprotein [Anaeromyxobacteraceae bacterium]|nr:SiaC family regulatory phosphoprotein [Anaeromyxobacteraceae bacterium]